MNSALVENNGVAYFGNCQLYFDRTLSIAIRVTLDSDGHFGGETGPNLTAEWEVSARALVLSAGGHEVEIPRSPPFHKSDIRQR